MKKALLIMALLISCIAAMAQKGANVFTGYLYNSEYQVFLKINFVEKNVVSTAVITPSTSLVSRAPK